MDWSVNEIVRVFLVVPVNVYTRPSFDLTTLEEKDTQPDECGACASHVTQGDSRFNFGTGRSGALGPLPIFRAPIAC